MKLTWYFYLGLYNAFLAPGSPCELNIDSTLRQDMASRMTRAVAKDDNSMYASLKDVAMLFERAQQQVFKLMAGVCILSLCFRHHSLIVYQDSVPKFTKSTRYIEIVGDYFEADPNAALGGPGDRRGKYKGN